MANQTLRQQIVEILKGGGSWIDKSTGNQYTLKGDEAERTLSLKDLPSEADFASASESEALRATEAIDEQLEELLNEKAKILKAHNKLKRVEEESKAESKAEPKVKAESKVAEKTEVKTEDKK